VAGSGGQEIYFQPRPRSKKHTEFMGKDEGVQITREEVIAHGFRILTDANRLSMNTRTVITSSKEVEQMFKRDVIHLFTPRATDL
jgi:hypothetical protein